MKICPACQYCYEDTNAFCTNDGAVLIPSRPGSLLIAGKYRLDRLLGRGGMGTVYVGTHEELDRPIAVKLLLPDFIADPQALERFRREARAAARLNHQNVVDVYDYGSLPEGGAYIVMELVEGQTLREFMDATKPMPVAIAVAIARQVADGIEAAHRRGIIHRDLKPSNIILTPDHDDLPQAKVADFGIAKLKEQTVGDGTLTLAGSLVGTPRYMSPEQCAGHDLSAHSDVYSLGVILYEMLVGRAPFEAPTATAIAIKHLQEPPPPLRNLRPDVPDTLAQLVMRALHKDPAARPQSAAEFGRQLRRFEHLTSQSSPANSDSYSFGETTTAAPSSNSTNPTTNPVGNSPATVASEAAVDDEPVTMVKAASALTSQVAAATAPVGFTVNASEQAGREFGAEESARATSRASSHRSVLYTTLAALSIALCAGGGAWWFAQGGRARINSPESQPVVRVSPAMPAPSSPVEENQTPTTRQTNTTLQPPAQPALSPEVVALKPTPSSAVTTPDTTLLKQQQDGEATVVASQPTTDATTTTIPLQVGPAAEERATLQAALGDWIATTNSRDLNGQMSFYAPNVDAFYLKRNVSRYAVQAEKSRLFKQAKVHDMRAGEPRVAFSPDGRIATMRFRKQYTNERNGVPHNGEVEQELRWVKTENGWKIISERDLRVIH